MLCHKKQDIRDSSRIMELSITVKQLIIKVKQVYWSYQDRKDYLDDIENKLGKYIAINSPKPTK
jgi:hypothetical protein